jgi:hypothetical protein
MTDTPSLAQPWLPGAASSGSDSSDEEVPTSAASKTDPTAGRGTHVRAVLARLDADNAGGGGAPVAAAAAAAAPLHGSEDATTIMRFQARHGKLNWRLIMSADLDRLTSSGHVESVLQVRVCVCVCVCVYCRDDSACS